MCESVSYIELCMCCCLRRKIAFGLSQLASTPHHYKRTQISSMNATRSTPPSIFSRISFSQSYNPSNSKPTLTLSTTSVIVIQTKYSLSLSLYVCIYIYDDHDELHPTSISLSHTHRHTTPKRLLPLLLQSTPYLMSNTEEPFSKVMVVEVGADTITVAAGDVLVVKGGE